MLKSSAEILAPAGTFDAVQAAVRCGANAVYLGGKTLNARRNAGNFTLEELKEAVGYCHAHGVKVHLALNTLASDEELKNEVQQALRDACEANIDALIIQDMGVLSLAKKCVPTMELHASTQMSVHTLAGVRQLADLGFSRAVLSRELSLEEIEYITKNSPIDIEVFVHGALCMCVSGQCLMSAMLGSRSANRGLCAQPCRLPFAAENGCGNDLSLKDLSAIDYLKRLSEIGVKSFKIEGRMKRPEYVAAAVTACKNAIDGVTDERLNENLKSVFSRSGFTDGYLLGSLGRDMFGIRRKEDVTAAAPILKELSQLYHKEKPRLAVDFAFSAYENDVACLAARAGGKSVFVEGDTLAQPALNVALSAEKIKQQLEKCGGTPFYPAEIEIDIDENISLPMSSINALRRECLDRLYNELSCGKPKAFHYFNVENSVKKVNNPRFYARFSNFNQSKFVGENVEKIILPLAEILKAESLNTEKTVAEIPRVFFGKENEVLSDLLKAKSLGVNCACCATLDAMRLAKEADMKILAGLGSNIFNGLSAQAYTELGAEELLLSPELTLTRAKYIGGNTGLLVYGRLPLMVTRNCPIKNGKTCAECKRQSSLTDRLGVKFPIRCENGYSLVLNSRPIYLAERMREVSFVDFNLFYFTTESAEECAQILTDYRQGKPADGEYTRGLYYRGVE